MAAHCRAKRRCCIDGSRRQSRQRALLPLRRPGRCLRGRRRTASPSRSIIRAIPARRSRPTASSRNTIRRGCLRHPGQFPGPVQHPRRDRARAEGAGQPAAAAHAARFRRQLRRQAGGLSLHRADGGGGARGRPSGEVDRGPARAPGGVGLGHQPCDPSATPPSRRMAASSRSTGTRSRIAARYLRAPGAGDALPHARQHDRRLRHPPCRHAQPRRRDQQDADRAQPRLWRPAGLFRAGAADAAHRAASCGSTRST